MSDKLFVIVDQRNNKRVCSGVWSESLGNHMIKTFCVRQQKGGRPDISAADVANLVLVEWNPDQGDRS